MKILHLTKWYPNLLDPTKGIFIKRQIDLISKNIDNKVIYLQKNSNQINNYIIKRTKKNNIEEFIIYYKKDNIISKINLLYICLKEIINYNPDLIHSHIMGWNSTLSYIIYKFKNIPFIVSEHWSGYSTKSKYKLSNLSKFIRILVAKNTKRLIVVSNSLKNEMIKFGIKSQFKIIPNVVDCKVSSVKKNKIFTFIFIGDLVDEVKNISQIIIAINELIKKNINVKLDIIGNGKDLKNLKNLRDRLFLNKKINFLGSKSKENIDIYIQKSHVLIINSFYESFSIVCVEALSLGIPVISSKCGGPEEYLTESTGILFDNNIPNSLINAMIEIKRNYKNYRKKNFIKISEKFKSIEVQSKINKLYEI